VHRINPPAQTARRNGDLNVMRVVPFDTFGAQAALVACHKWRLNVRRYGKCEGLADRMRLEAAALSKAYQRTDDVPDALWAQALTLTHAWATAGGPLDGAP
jgi:hypothetical protein